MAPLALIVAYARDRVIGRAGRLPWHEPEDLQHFRATTMGHPVILGRRSHQAIGRSLPGRLNIVITARPDYRAPGCTVVPSLTAALQAARAGAGIPFICGGAVLYAAALPLVTRLHLTEIDRVVTGDTYFPPVDESAFEEVERRRSGDLTFRVLDRRPAAPVAREP